jgi:hypothetical protein
MIGQPRHGATRTVRHRWRVIVSQSQQGRYGGAEGFGVLVGMRELGCCEVYGFQVCHDAALSVLQKLKSRGGGVCLGGRWFPRKGYTKFRARPAMRGRCGLVHSKYINDMIYRVQGMESI